MSYKIISNGEILPGFDAAIVTKNLAKIFKENPESIQRLLLKKSITLQSGLSQEKADLYKIHLGKAGLKVDICQSVELSLVAQEPEQNTPEPDDDFDEIDTMAENPSQAVMQAQAKSNSKGPIKSSSQDNTFDKTDDSEDEAIQPKRHIPKASGNYFTQGMLRYPFTLAATGAGWLIFLFLFAINQEMFIPALAYPILVLNLERLGIRYAEYERFLQGAMIVLFGFLWSVDADVSLLGIFFGAIMMFAALGIFTQEILFADKPLLRSIAKLIFLQDRVLRRRQKSSK